MNNNNGQKLLFVGDTVPEKPFQLDEGLRQLCRRHDLRVFNLEGACSRFQQPLLKAGSHLLLDMDLLERVAGFFNVAILANNHAMDFGIEGLDTTMLQCRKHGILTVGAGLDQEEAMRPLDTACCRLIAVAENEFGAAGPGRAGVATTENERAIFDCITEGQRLGKFVVVFAHGGTEVISAPPPYLRHRYRLWIDFGANLIIGNHPHTVQGYEFYKGRAIFYSLGNFIFPRDVFRQYSNTDWSLAVSADTATGRIELYPVGVDDEGRVRILEGPQYAQEMHRLCGLLEAEDYERRYQQTAMDLYGKWYTRLQAQNPQDAALLLHFLRCDAHRHLLQTALSQLTGEISSPKAAVASP